MSYMDPLQAWIIICRYFKLSQAAANIFMNPESKTNVPPTVADAINVIDKHIDERLYGEDETEIIMTASDCQEDGWYQHLDRMLNDIGDISQ